MGKILILLSLLFSLIFIPVSVQAANIVQAGTNYPVNLFQYAVDENTKSGFEPEIFF